MMRLTIRHAEGGEVDEADESDKSEEGEEVGGSEVGDESASLPRSFSEVMRGVMSDCSDDEQPPSKVRKPDSAEVSATATAPQHRHFKRASLAHCKVLQVSSSERQSKCSMEDQVLRVRCLLATLPEW